MRVSPAVAVVLLLPLASAGPLHALDGFLASEAPWTAQGDLSARGEPVHLLAQWQPDSLAVGTRLIETPHAKMRLIRQDSLLQDSMLGPWLSPEEAGPAAPVVDLRITILGFNEAPQFWIYPMDHMGGNVQLPDAQCGVTSRAPPIQFPADPDADPTARVWSSPGQWVKADCTAEKVWSQTTMKVLLYGLRLRVESSEGSSEIQTGRTEETDVLGVRRTVTQILMLDPMYSGAVPGTLNAVGPLRVRLEAPSLAWTGTLATPPSIGSLQWADQRFMGAVPALSAGGVFFVNGTKEGALGLAGRSWEAPPESLGGLVIDAGVPLALLGPVVGFVALSLLAAFLYSRLLPERALIHPRRQAILSAVRASPGLPVGTLARQLGISPTKTKYHVAVLARGGLLRVHSIDGRRAVFETRPQFLGEPRQSVLMARPHLRALHETLQAGGPMSQDELVARLGRSRSQICRSLGDLVRAGLAATCEGGLPYRYVHLRPVSGGSVVTPPAGVGAQLQSTSPMLSGP